MPDFSQTSSNSISAENSSESFSDSTSTKNSFAPESASSFGGFPELSSISGLGPFTSRIDSRPDEKMHTTHPRTLYLAGNDKVFLVDNSNTIELRSDPELIKKLRHDYESVMLSRYFGRGGIEIALTGQLTDSDLADLIRLSYNLTSAL